MLKDYIRIDVATPADYEIPFENLELTSSDGVRIKAYFMKQRKQLVGHAPEASVDESISDELTDDEVCLALILML